MAPPSGLRTPSPTKSRLPLGSNLPQRTGSLKISAIAPLKPLIRRISVKDPAALKKPAISRTGFQGDTVHRENEPPNHQAESLTNTSSVPLSRTKRVAGRQVDVSALSKPATSSPGNLVFSRETLDPRLELLHLHAIHRSSHKTQDQWQEHAFNHYRQKFECLQTRDKELNQLEIEALTQTNATAIISWGSQGNGLEKQIQALSRVVDQVDHLTSKNGKYSLAILAFEHWIDSVTDLQTQRARSRGRTGPNVIEGLGDGWLAEIESLQIKLVNYADIMLGIADISTAGTDIGRTITVVSEMLKNMLEELDMVLSIERNTVEEEKDWMEGSIATITNQLNKGFSLG